MPCLSQGNPRLIVPVELDLDALGLPGMPRGQAYALALNGPQHSALVAAAATAAARASAGGASPNLGSSPPPPQLGGRSGAGASFGASSNVSTQPGAVGDSGPVDFGSGRTQVALIVDTSGSILYSALAASAGSAGTGGDPAQFGSATSLSRSGPVRPAARSATNQHHQNHNHASLNTSSNMNISASAASLVSQTQVRVGNVEPSARSGPRAGPPVRSASGGYPVGPRSRRAGNPVATAAAAGATRSNSMSRGQDIGRSLDTLDAELQQRKRQGSHSRPRRSGGPAAAVGSPQRPGRNTRSASIASPGDVRLSGSGAGSGAGPGAGSSPGTGKGSGTVYSHRRGGRRGVDGNSRRSTTNSMGVGRGNEDSLERAVLALQVNALAASNGAGAGSGTGSAPSSSRTKPGSARNDVRNPSSGAAGATPSKASPHTRARGGSRPRSPGSGTRRSANLGGAATALLSSTRSPSQTRSTSGASSSTATNSTSTAAGARSTRSKRMFSHHNGSSSSRRTASVSPPAVGVLGPSSMSNPLDSPGSLAELEASCTEDRLSAASMGGSRGYSIDAAAFTFPDELGGGPPSPKSFSRGLYSDSHGLAPDLHAGSSDQHVGSSHTRRGWDGNPHEVGRPPPARNSSSAGSGTLLSDSVSITSANSHTF